MSSWILALTALQSACFESSVSDSVCVYSATVLSARIGVCVTSGSVKTVSLKLWSCTEHTPADLPKLVPPRGLRVQQVRPPQSAHGIPTLAHTHILIALNFGKTLVITPLLNKHPAWGCLGVNRTYCTQTVWSSQSLLETLLQVSIPSYPLITWHPPASPTPSSISCLRWHLKQSYWVSLRTWCRFRDRADVWMW